MSANEQYVIREYLAADTIALRDCVAELQDFERAIDPRLRPGDSMAADYLDHMLGRCREWGGTVFVAESGDAIAGFAMVLAHVPFDGLDEPPGEYALVSDLVVREPFRRRGIGEELLQAAERYARSIGALELRIGVLSENVGAARLYHKVGFVPYVATLSKRLTSASAQGAAGGR